MTPARLARGGTGPAAPVPRLVPRADASLPQRLAASAARTFPDDQGDPGGVLRWLAERAAAHAFTVRRTPLDALDGWSFSPEAGDLVHHTGGFFQITGLAAEVGEGAVRRWEQPVIRQPETGILGLLVKEFDGVPHFLLQAKMEPGNRNLVQLSPTVQATRSNYARLHRGSPVRYLEYFTGQAPGLVHTDVLQSEHGSWFHGKRNRNMLVETGDDVPAHDDFRWLTLGQIGQLLRSDNVVNMDTRTVLASLPVPHTVEPALHSDAELLSWLSSERTRRALSARRVPLSEVAGWRRGDGVIARPDGHYFRVVGVSVSAGSREVSGWSQPMLEPTGTGVVAFLLRHVEGVPHLLVRARVEAGFRDVVELGPTVQATPRNWERLPLAEQPPYLAAVRRAPRRRVRYRAVHSEEGGRFLNAESHYLFVAADESQWRRRPPDDFRWVTPAQLSLLAARGMQVNVQARTLLACLRSGAVPLDPA
ncbi:NDP-hexose 2,3-dehydratase family protein [Streptomyces sp. DSM 44915]|uniref:NDP-hexose 2,3-dehydratase family protein n=1 Tax=Streptomyces chisholmiae TaxID=3075540 RepID=A0ABU2JMB2_9ACTN|nr:NDP-hexose 2,3-dehydratase family protein [Streptomyces sp. DSM 44915]MDT0266125.1 NDP-hexose 2,3-dehydratase family protein [Streptomyces sp. DSM 44915]